VQPARGAKRKALFKFNKVKLGLSAKKAKVSVKEFKSLAVRNDKDVKKIIKTLNLSALIIYGKIKAKFFKSLAESKALVEFEK